MPVFLKYVFLFSCVQYWHCSFSFRRIEMSLTTMLSPNLSHAKVPKFWFFNLTDPFTIFLLYFLFLCSGLCYAPSKIHKLKLNNQRDSFVPSWESTEHGPNISWAFFQECKCSRAHLRRRYWPLLDRKYYVMFVSSGSGMLCDKLLFYVHYPMYGTLLY